MTVGRRATSPNATSSRWKPRDLRALRERLLQPVLQIVEVDIGAVRHDLDLGGDVSHC